MKVDHTCTGQPGIKEELEELNQAANRLLSSTKEDESWEEIVHLIQKWDERIQILVRGLSAEQLLKFGSEVKKIADKNLKIKGQLEALRAKVLTQIQENTHSRSAIQQYTSSV